MQHIEQARLRDQIEPSKGPWACNPVLVVQGDKIRFCVDFRKLNAVTRRDSHGLGNMDDLLQKVAGAGVLSSLDLAAGYHQLPLRKEDRCKTAFLAPNGSLWQYKVAPFGLVNLPAQFTRVVHDVLGDALGTYAVPYIDDVLIFSPDMETHIQHVETVLSRLRAAGMSVARHKCQFLRPEVKYLGHVVSADRSAARP